MDNQGTKKPLVLIIDDDPPIGELLLEVFSEDYQPILTQNGVEALEKLRTNEFDVIISDLWMPELNGIEFFKIIQTEFPQYRNKIIFTTGLLTHSEDVDFLNKFNLPYLHKPFRLNELCALVESILNQNQSKKIVST